ncbi:MAG: OmpA family protein [Phycisphaeraceae bacterium]|nr:OmpA family protein [Phycisphaeraceae bacterium]
MRRLAIALLPFTFALSLLGGCDSAQKDEIALLKQETDDLRKQLADRNAALDSLERERLAAVARADAAERSGPSATPTAQPQMGFSESGFEGITGVTATRVGNEVHVSIEGDVLFDSGRTELKPASRRSLDRVASVIREKYPGRDIRVVGFTDTDPIRRSGFKSNYHLGFDRAYTVREYLVSKGLDGRRISLASFGPDQPRATKAQSRRVEIIVIGA